jgi:hypothetical protein
VVFRQGLKSEAEILDHANLPDPSSLLIQSLNERIESLEERLRLMEERAEGKPSPTVLTKK